MNKAETIKFMRKIKAYYPMFSNEDYVIEEWVEKLKPYSKDDIERKFDEHINGSYALNPPQLHFLTKFLKTEEQKEKSLTDFIVRCNLCGEEMYLSDYDNEHYKKCLLIKTLIPLLEKKGEIVDYKSLNQYDFKTLEKVYDKYVPLKKEINYKGAKLNVKSGNGS